MGWNIATTGGTHRRYTQDPQSDTSHLHGGTTSL